MLGRLLDEEHRGRGRRAPAYSRADLKRSTSARRSRHSGLMAGRSPDFGRMLGQPRRAHLHPGWRCGPCTWRGRRPRRRRGDFRVRSAGDDSRPAISSPRPVGSMSLRFWPSSTTWTAVHDSAENRPLTRSADNQFRRSPVIGDVEVGRAAGAPPRTARVCESNS